MSGPHVKTASPIGEKPLSTSNCVFWLARFASCLLLVSACVGAYLVWSAPSRLLERAMLLTAAPDQLDLGEIWETSEFQCTLTVENRTRNDVEVAEFIASCPSTSFEPRSTLIPRRGKANVTVALDLTKVSGGCGSASNKPSEIGDQPRDFAIRIQPLLSEGMPPQTPWVLRGRVRPAFTLSPTILYFDQRVQGNLFPPGQVWMEHHAILTNVEAHCDPTFAAVEVSAKPDSHLFTITPLPTLPHGPFRFEIIAQATLEKGQQVTGKVSVIGQVLSEIYSSPEIVTFGARPLGEKFDETIVLQSRSGQSFDVLSVDCDRNALTVEVVEPSTDRIRMYRVSQRITQSGDQTSALRFRVRRTGAADEESVRLVITYRGLPAQSAAESHTGS